MTTVGLTAPTVFIPDDHIQTNKNDPLILSTWQHGLPAIGLGEEVIKTSGSFLVVKLMRQGYDPTAACTAALNRVIKPHNGNPDFQIAYIAIRKDGSACIKQSFEYALARRGQNKLHKIRGII